MHVIIGGDYKRVLHSKDTTARFHTSRALKEIERGMALTDTWAQNPTQPTHPRYSTLLPQDSIIYK
jgi:hypothetical protein